MALRVNENGTIRTLGGESVDFIAYRGSTGTNPFGTDEYPSFLYKELVFDNLVDGVMYSKDITFPFTPTLAVIFPANGGNSRMMDTLRLYQGEGFECNIGSSNFKAGYFFSVAHGGYGFYLQGTSLTVKFRVDHAPAIPKAYLNANIFIIGGSY
ncbi:MAG: hypothetical protein J6Y02_24140 [Pseudobutyrivibrio sp.]|nr:hypothetical protein [Pseudobutyrivibrio sp.]